MIVFIVYLAILLLVIYFAGLSNLFTDPSINRKKFAICFGLKALAVPVFYYLFLKLYGGIENFDAGKFYHDSKVLNQLALQKPGEYFNMLLGLQDEAEGSFFYETITKNTYNWDNGEIRDFLYNDNRIVIRIHSLFHFIAFNSYFAHALFSCFLSYVGIVFLYKAFKQYFVGRELLFFVALCFFPSLWIYTGALLKEGLALFVLGGISLLIKQFFQKGVKFSWALWMLVLLFFSLLLKPYLLFYAFLYFTLFGAIEFLYHGKRKILFFSFLMALAALSLNTTSLLLKNKSFVQAAMQRGKEFSDLAKGGIFLLDSVKFVRIEYDYALVKEIKPDSTLAKKNDSRWFTIREGVPFIYQEHHHQQDTLYCDYNRDTISRYSLVYDLPKAGSSFEVGLPSDPTILRLLKSLFYTVSYPLFYNATGFMQVLASFENLLLVLSILYSFWGMFFRRQSDPFPAFNFLTFGLTLFVLIGFTSPNVGAILRYRAPVAIFILMAAIYYLKPQKRLLGKVK